MRNLSESRIEKEVTAYAGRRGWFSRGVQYRGRTGCPDRVFIRNGVTVWVEFKRFGEEPTEIQKREHQKFRQAGVTVHVIDNIPAGEMLFDSFERQT